MKLTEKQRRAKMAQLAKQFDSSMLKIRGHINDYVFKVRLEDWRYEIEAGGRLQ